MGKGILYLLPVTLGDDDFQMVIPEKVLDITKSLRHFIVEDIRSARRYLRHIDRSFPIDESQFSELSEHTRDTEIAGYLDPALNGSNIGLLSEAGMPAIADPGNKIVRLAHKKGVTVKPLSGPSSIIMALISSGMNGQNFSFHGYLPVKQGEREARLRDLEAAAIKGYSQVFIETPYRAHRMLESIIHVCRKETNLCIASDLTTGTEMVKSKSILEWQKSLPLIEGRLVVFILGQ